MTDKRLRTIVCDGSIVENPNLPIDPRDNSLARTGCKSHFSGISCGRNENSQHSWKIKCNFSARDYANNLEVTFVSLTRDPNVSPILESLDYFRQYDFYTYRHILIVLALTTFICQDLVVDYQELMQENAAGAIYDIGKICVPMQILKKISPLTQTERAILEHHAAVGFVILCYYHQDSQHLAAIKELTAH